MQMAKWFKSFLQDFSKLFGVPTPVRTATVQKYQSWPRLLKRSWPLPFVKSRFGNGNSVLVQNLPSLFTNRGFANCGSLAMLSPPLNSPLRYFAHSNLHRGMKIRHSYKEPWMMSDEEVRGLITMHECEGSLKHGIVSKYESNQLPSNNPTEDRRFVTSLLYESNTILFGVLDGHGGDNCAHNISQRLSDYIGIALLPPEILLHSEVKSYFSSRHLLDQNSIHNYNFCQDPVCYGNLKAFFLEQRRIQRRLKMMVPDSLSTTHLRESSHAHQEGFTEAKEDQVIHTMKAISKAFLRLDDDLSQEALFRGEDKDTNALRFTSALSGACALVAHIKGTELTVANCGDCRAVLGVQGDDGLWSALQLSHDHTSGK